MCSIANMCSIELAIPIELTNPPNPPPPVPLSLLVTFRSYTQCRCGGSRSSRIIMEGILPITGMAVACLPHPPTMRTESFAESAAVVALVPTAA